MRKRTFIQFTVTKKRDKSFWCWYTYIFPLEIIEESEVHDKVNISKRCFAS